MKRTAKMVEGKHAYIKIAPLAVRISDFSPVLTEDEYDICTEFLEFNIQHDTNLAEAYLGIDFYLEYPEEDTLEEILKRGDYEFSSCNPLSYNFIDILEQLKKVQPLVTESDLMFPFSVKELEEIKGLGLDNRLTKKLLVYLDEDERKDFVEQINHYILLKEAEKSVRQSVRQRKLQGNIQKTRT